MAFLDTNNNGLSDLWEKTYNNNQLFSNSYDPQADSDGDGWTNLQEATAGTNPTNANPPGGYLRPTQANVPALYITGPDGLELLTPEAYSLTWPTKIGKLYTLSYSTDLTQSSWLAIDIPLIGNGNVMGKTVPITQPDGGIPEKLFWRVSVNDTDSDNDGLTNSEENQLGTNPTKADTDGDGLDDKAEILAGTSALINQFLANPDAAGLANYGNSVNLAAGLRAVWGFDSMNSSQVFDTSGNGFHGAINGTIFQSLTSSGPLSKTGTFDNPADYFKAPNNVFPNSAHGDGTVAFWFKGNSPSTTRILFSRDTGNFPLSWCVYSAQNENVLVNGVVVNKPIGRLIFNQGVPNGTVVTRGFRIPNINPFLDTIADQKWHHITISSNNQSLRFSIDGISDHIATSLVYRPFGNNNYGGAPSNPSNSSGFYAGTVSSSFSSAGLNGEIDQFLIYDRALSAAEKLKIFNIDSDGDGVSNRQELAIGTKPFVYETDSDKDGLTNLQELQLGTNPTNFDSDGDLLPDGWEVTYTLDPKSGSGIHGKTGNVDNDGLDNLEEYVNGTNPRVADTDSDTISDGAEVAAGTDPLDSSDKPFNPIDILPPAISDTNVVPIGNLGIIYSADASVYQFVGEFGDGSDSHSERWQLNVGSKRKVNREYGVVKDFTMKLNNSQIWEVGIEHVATNIQSGEADYDYNFEVTGKPGFIFVDKSSLVGAYDDQDATDYWSDKKAYLIPTRSSSYSASFSGSDAVGPRYRKIALNGRPLPDEKPEAEEETEIHSEETYIDAFDLSLHHDTSFASIPLAASDLHIEANASVRETGWSDRSGLRPNEELTSPFGVGWSSNLCSYIEISETKGEVANEPASVNVVDEAGRSQRFGTANGQTFFPWPSAQVDKKTYLNTLLREGTNLVLYKKYGSKLTYSPCNAWFAYSTDRLSGSDKVRRHTYLRLTKVQDRYGNEVLYNYGTSTLSLIPQTISAVGRAGQQLTIARSPNGRRVDSITDARGKVTTFNYTSRGAGITSYTTLDSVSYADGTSQSYTYEAVSDLEVVDNKVTQYYHCNLKTISDRRGNTHTLNYAFDRSKSTLSTSGSGKTEFAVSIGGLPGDVAADAKSQLADMNENPPNGQATYRVQYGQPRLVTGVTLPGGIGSSSFAKTGFTQYGPTFSAAASTTATDANSKATTYTFSGIQGEITDLKQSSQQDTSSLSVEWMIYYTTMTVNHAGLGTETFKYDVRSGLSLSEMKDFSGNTTTWNFGETLSNNGIFPLAANSAARAAGFMTKWADPTSKTDALNRTESYQYGPFRVMARQTDVYGTVTETAVDGLGRRKNMTITGADGVKFSEETYLYDDEDGDATTNFPGFMVEKRVVAFTNLSGKPWEQDLVTKYIADSRGRLWKEIVGPAGLALTTITTYDLHNNKLTVTDPRTALTTFNYDDLNRLYRIDYPTTATEAGALASSKFIYFDANGAKAVEVDENSRWTAYRRDALNRVSYTIRDMDGSVRPTSNASFIVADAALANASTAGDLITQTEYDAVNFPIRAIDARGISTVAFADAMQRPTHRFSGVPPGQAITLAALTSLAASSRIVTHDEFSYEQNVTIAGISYQTSPGASGFSSSGFKPTRLIRHNAVRENLAGADTSLTTVAVYDEVYRPLATSEIYATGAEKRSITQYGTISNGIESLNSVTTDSLGKISETFTDAMGRVIQTTEAKGTILQGNSYRYYSSTGLAWKTTDELSRDTESDFDLAGRATHQRQPDPVSGLVTATSPLTQTFYDATSNVTKIINPRLLATETDYDARNRPWRVRLPAVTDYSNPASPIPNVRPTSLNYYDLAGNITLSTDPQGSSTRSYYDFANRATASRNNPLTGSPAAPFATPGANDITTTQILDPGGLVLSAMDGNGNSTRNAYDSIGRLTASATEPLTGNPADPGAPGFNAATFRAGTGILVTNLYDDLGNLIEVADGKNQLTGFTYDGQKRKTRTIWDPGSPVQRIELSEYNALLQTARLDPKNQRTEYGYDARQRNTTVDYLSRPVDNRLNGYDLAGKLLSVTYSNDTGSLRNATQTYDKLDRLTSETSAGVTHSYSLYDNAGNRQHTVYGGTNRALVSTYDALNRLSSVTEKDDLTAATGRLTTYGYDRRSKVTLKVMPNSNRNTTSYDFLGRTTRIEERAAAAILISASDYTAAVAPWPSSYDNVGNVLRIAETYSQAGLSDRVVTNAYDKVHRLLTETATPTSGPATLTSYTYDSAHNRSTKTTAGVISTFEYGTTADGYNSNQLKSVSRSVGVSPTSYTYDSNGNRATQSLNNTLEKTLTYDTDNRLINLTLSNGAKYNYAYDHRTRRIIRDESLAGGEKTALTYSGGTSVQESQIQEIQDPYADPDGDGQNNFLEFATLGDPLRGNSSATFYAPGNYEQWAQAAILARSTLASIISYRTARTTLKIELIRGSDWGGGVGGILYTIKNNLRSYNAYNSRGDVISTTADNGSATWQASYQAYGTRTQEQGLNTSRQRANTKEEDPTGLLNEGHRYRDLDSGTFITRDPLGFVDGPNVYTYVRQNPWTYYDPYGLFEWSKVGESVGNTIYGVAELAQSLVGSVVEIGTGGLSGEGMNARRGEIMAGMVEGTVETAGGLIDASHQAVGGHWGAAAQTAAGTLGETPEEAVANGGLMVLTAGASRYLKGKGSAPTSSARGVAEGQVATRAELKAREITGDGLDIHEAPSQAAIKERLSQKLGRAPTPEELKRATDRLPATAIPTPVHAETRTFFNKNTKTQVKGDANDLDAAARADAESLSAAGYKKTASQMEKKWKKSELREELK